jgi:tetratricopeptide (TPR) repeat protein
VPVVFIPAVLRPLAGGRESVAVEGETVRQIIDSLEKQHPGIADRLLDQGRLRPNISVAVDGIVTPLGLLEEVGPQSEIHFVHAIAGGRGRMLALIALALIAALGCGQTPEKRAARFLELGMDQFEKKRYEHAILEFLNALQHTPMNPEVHYRLGMAYLANRNPGAAVRHLQKAADTGPQNTNAQMELARILLGVDDKAILKDAESRIGKVLAAEPGNVAALHIQALCWLRLGRDQQAIEQLNRVLEKSPNHWQSSLAVAAFYVSQKRFTEAEKFLRQAMANSPSAVEPVLALGRLQILRGSAQEAELVFQQALRIDPENASALFELAKLHADAGRPENAQKALKKLSSLPEAGLKSIHAIFLYQTGRREAAIKELEQLNQQDPADRDVRNRLVQLYIDAGREADAEKLLRLAATKDSDPDALEQLARIHLENGRLVQAEADLLHSLRIRPRSAAGHYLMAQLRRRLGQTLMRRQALSEALKFDPSLLAARIELSELFRASGGAKTALDLLDKMPEEQKGHPAAIAERNWVLIALGDFNAARKGVDQGLAKGTNSALILQDGLLDLRMHQLRQARGKLEMALAAEPQNLLALESLAQSFEMEKKPQAATERVRAHADTHPRSASVQHFLGNWLEKSGDRNGARLAYAEALKADPQFVSSEIATARLDLLEKNWNEARRRLERTIQSHPRNTDLLLAQGMLEDEIGDQSAAISAYRRLLEVDPNHPYALNNLAYRLAEQPDQVDEALKLAQRAKELLPEDPAVDDTIGWAFYRKGLYPIAVSHLERAVAKAPTARRRYHLAMAYFQAGSRAKGERALEEALKMDPNLPEATLAIKISAGKP